jgi:FkbM family methyltransferase
MSRRKISGFCEEIRRAAHLTVDLRSLARLSFDLLLYRHPFIDIIPRKWMNKERSIRIRDGITLTYRLNKGDIWSLREVWLFECYKFPANIHPEWVLDLGANIGMTSVWLASRYPVRKIIAVEPATSNEALIRHNLMQNQVDAIVIAAAIGSRDGSVAFVEHSASNFGKADYNKSGSTPLISMNTLMKRYCNGKRIDLLKLDIEGGEQELLGSNLEWLEWVDAIIAEFHTGCVDYPGLVMKLQKQGFRYIPANSVFPDNMDSFIREPLPT